MKIAQKTLARSALIGLFLTVEGIGLQVANSLLIVHDGPPSLGHLVGVTACYLAAGFTFALGFFLVRERFPGRTPVRKGLRYAATVLTAVWISGFINLCAVDFTSGWNLLTPARIANYLMAPIDCLNFMVGGLVLGLITRKDTGTAPVSAPFTASLAVRISVGAVLLPLLCAGLFFLISLVLPTGFDLSGDRLGIFYVFLFVPLVISGGGTALLHDALRSGVQRAAAAVSFRISAFIFVVFWLSNVAFVLFFGFTWQVVIGFLAAMAVSLVITITTLETIARAGSGAKAARRAAVTAALVAALFLQSCATKPIEVKTPDFASLPDGTYRGEYDGGLVKAVVDVQVADGRIEKVTIISHRNGMGQAAEAIVDDVVTKQSLEVDTISGATRSSKVILKAIEAALSK